MQRWSLECFIFFSKVYILGFEVWLIPFGIMQSKSQLDRWIFNIYFPNNEKLKYFVKTFTPHNQILSNPGLPRVSYRKSLMLFAAHQREMRIRLYSTPLMITSVAGGSSSLKGQCHEIFDFRFFYESVFPKPLSIPLGPVSNFFENSRRYAQLKFAAGVVDTGGASSLANISANFRKIRTDPKVIFGGTWGKMVHEKESWRKQSRDTVPLNSATVGLALDIFIDIDFVTEVASGKLFDLFGFRTGPQMTRIESTILIYF